MALVTVDPTVQVAYGDWVHLPAVEKGLGIYGPEAFVCLSPGGRIRRVEYHPATEDGAASIIYVVYFPDESTDEYEGTQANALREELLRRCPVQPEDAAEPTG